MPYTVLMPVFARDGAPRRPAHAGLPDGRVGLRRAASARSTWRTRRVGRRPRPRDRRSPARSFGAGLIAFSLAHVLWLALPCLVVTGFGLMVQMASSNTILQTIVDDDKRGRVMSFYTMAFLGTAPFGSLIAGWLSSRIGAPHTLLLGGICCLRGAVWFARELPAIRVAVRPIYVRMGILPEVAAGICGRRGALGAAGAPAGGFQISEFRFKSVAPRRLPRGVCCLRQEAGGVAEIGSDRCARRRRVWRRQGDRRRP